MLGAHAVHVHLQAGIIKILGDEHIGNTGHRSDLSDQAAGDIVADVQVHAAHLDINGSRHSLIENGIHQAAGLKIGAQLGHLPGNALTHLIHVRVAIAFMLFL